MAYSVKAVALFHGAPSHDPQYHGAVKPLNLRGFYRLVFADSAVKESTKFNKRALIPWFDGSYSFI